MNPAINGELNKLMLAGGPAFPSETENSDRSRWYFPGMTLRDYFAAVVLQGMNANPELMEHVTSAARITDTYFGKMAEKAYAQADEMLRVRLEKR